MSAAAGSVDDAHAMNLGSSQQQAVVDDEADPEVIREVDHCGDLVVAHKFATEQPIKYGDKYAAHLLAREGPTVYFPVGSATHTWEVAYAGELSEEVMTQERAGK